MAPIVRWKATGFTGVARPGVDAGAVYVIDSTAVVRAFDKQTGAVRWATPLPVASDPDTYDVTVVAGTVDVGATGLFGLDPATGQIRWHYAPRGHPAWNLLPNDSTTVYAGALGVGGGTVYGVDAASGVPRWVGDLGIALQPGESVTTFGPALADGRVYVAYAHFLANHAALSGAAALDAATGRVLWRTDYPVPPGDSSVGTNNGLSASVGSGLVVGTTFRGMVHALDATTGAVRWSARALVASVTTPGDYRPTAITGDVVVVGASSGAITAFRASDGTQLWQHAVFFGSPSALTADASSVYTLYFGGRVTAQALATGATRWTLIPGDLGFIGPPRLDGATAYLAGEQGLWAVALN